MAMTEKERNLIPEAIKTIMQLPPEMQERLLWMGQGMLLAGKGNVKNDRSSAN